MRDVRRKRAAGDAVQVQGGEAVVDEQARGLVAIALSPRVALAEHDRELRGAVDGVDGLERDVPDVPAVLAPRDGEHERVAAGGDAGDPVARLGARVREDVMGVRRQTSCVVEPLEVGPVDVGGRQRAQRDALTEQEGRDVR